MAHQDLLHRFAHLPETHINSAWYLLYIGCCTSIAVWYDIRTIAVML